MEAVSRGDTALVLERETELAEVDAFMGDLTSGLSRIVAAQIAQALFVTVKTVESHLACAYRKLGICSRRDLPASLANLERE